WLRGAAWRRCLLQRRRPAGSPLSLWAHQKQEGQAMKRPNNELIYHGVIGGILAGLVVVLWFLVVDSLAGNPFGTPAALASAIFDNRPATATTFRLVAMYSVLHFGVFALLGVCAAWVMVAL